jgi:hypothetical protein
LNDDYQYSIRAFTYQNGRTVPLPPLLLQDVLAGLKVARLHAHQTGLDTAIVAKETNKGNALVALLQFAGLSAKDAIAIGDSEPDLAMFRVAGRAFAPGNVTCSREAGLSGCNIVRSLFQPGLLEIVQKIAHPQGGACDRCRAVTDKWRKKNCDLFVTLLKAADEKPFPQLLRNCWSPAALDIFRI